MSENVIVELKDEGSKSVDALEDEVPAQGTSASLAAVEEHQGSSCPTQGGKRKGDDPLRSEKKGILKSRPASGRDKISQLFSSSSQNRSTMIAAGLDTSLPAYRPLAQSTMNNLLKPAARPPSLRLNSDGRKAHSLLALSCRHPHPATARVSPSRPVPMNWTHRSRHV